MTSVTGARKSPPSRPQQQTAQHLLLGPTNSITVTDHRHSSASSSTVTPTPMISRGPRPQILDERGCEDPHGDPLLYTLTSGQDASMEETRSDFARTQGSTRCLADALSSSRESPPTKWSTAAARPREAELVSAPVYSTTAPHRHREAPPETARRAEIISPPKHGNRPAPSRNMHSTPTPG